MRKKNNPYYVSNKQLFAAMVEYKNQLAEAQQQDKQPPRLPEYVGQCIMLIAQKLATKGNFCDYSYKDEMISDGIENCLHRDTEILTLDKGPIAISKVVDQTVIVKCIDDQWRPAIVKAYGKQQLFKYMFGSFNTRARSLTQSVIATSNHRWFIQARVNDKGLFDWENQVVTDLRCGDMLQNVSDIEQSDYDSEGVIHGIIFGDGSVEKKDQRTVDKLLCTQGREYPFIRVCKQDRVQKQIIQFFEQAGYKPSFPPSSNGDPVYYMGRGFFKKELPFTNDPNYIAGFIYGWWLADGHKTVNQNRLVITTTNKNAVDWVRSYAAYGGFQLTGVYYYTGGKRFANAKPLYQITLSKNSLYKTRVRSIEYFGEEEVFCVEEPITQSFVLANGILTGNCVKYINNFNPEKSNNPFAYITQIIKNSFIRRIQSEKRQQAIKYKNMIDTIPEWDQIVPDHQFNEVAYNVISAFETTLTNKKNKAKKDKQLAAAEQLPLQD